MRLRTLHLASILLLLSSLSAAEGATLRSGEFGLGGHYIGMILGQASAKARAEVVLDARAHETSEFSLPAASIAQHRAAWTMPAPAAHSAQLQAVTGFGI
jgi:hypothetical protein